ncbi:MAG: phosphotransferase [Planctomycetota bacterium]|nr:phosphotransferase [Planctomycetota bacterium]
METSPTFLTAPELDEDLRAAAALLPIAAESLHPLTPEAGARRYYRPTPECGWLIVISDAPPPHATALWLSGCDLRTPALASPTRLAGGVSNRGGWAYLAEDFGDTLFCTLPDAGSYAALLAGWERFAFRPLPADHPQAALALDAALFRRELGMFLERWLQTWRRRALAADEVIAARAALDQLAHEAADGPQCMQHRDFHSRNLVHLHQPATRPGEIGWLDHQDLRRGPLYYDLASLATDAYVDLPEAVVRLLADAVPAWGASHGLSEEAARERFHYSALQRVLKALGTFGNLLAQGRDEYRPAETRALAHAHRLFAERPELCPELRTLMA